MMNPYNYNMYTCTAILQLVPTVLKIVRVKLLVFPQITYMSAGTVTYVWHMWV